MPVRLSSCAERLARLPRAAAILPIRLYQRTLSPVLPALFGPACGCRFTPTCSQYAVQALASHGLLAGSWLSLRRLSRCHPFHPGGVDPVPARPVPRCTRAHA